MISVCMNLKMNTSPHSVRLCLNIHVSVRTLEELRRPGEQQNSVVRNTMIVMVEITGLFYDIYMPCFISDILQVIKNILTLRTNGLQNGCFVASCVDGLELLQHNARNVMSSVDMV